MLKKITVSGVSVQRRRWPEKFTRRKEGGQFDRNRNFDLVKFPKKQSIDELRNSFYFIILDSWAKPPLSPSCRPYEPEAGV